MRKIMLSATAAALVIASGTAFAAIHTEQATIASINPMGGTITVDSGKYRTFRLGQNVSTMDLRLGDKVDVTYELSGKSPVAIAIEAVDVDRSQN